MRETTRHRLAFDAYVDLGAGRSIERLHAHLAAQAEVLEGQKVPVLRTLYRWSKELGWQRRCDEIEREARARQRRANVERVSEIYERQAREGQVLQQEGLRWLRTLDPERVNASAATRAIVEGAKLERIAFGEPGEITAELDEDSALARLERFSDEQLERLAGIVNPEPEDTGRTASD